MKCNKLVMFKGVSEELKMGNNTIYRYMYIKINYLFK